MCTEKMEEYGINDEDLSGEVQVETQFNYLKIVANDNDDSTVRLSGAVNKVIETMSGDVEIRINDEDEVVAVVWLGEWALGNEITNPLPKSVKFFKVRDELNVFYEGEINKVSWRVEH